MKTVMVFGTFDGIHEGHRVLFRRAREYGDYLIVALAPDEIVKRLKGKRARKCLEERMMALADEGLVDAIVQGDPELGSYAVVKKERPHIVALGYDQKVLEKDLRGRLNDFDWDLTIVTLAPHKPERYHNSFL